jgi:DNA-binding HxlR family transcriptional regulator
MPSNAVWMDMSTSDLNTSAIVSYLVAAPGGDVPSTFSFNLHRKGTLEILAYFYRERHGRCEEVALATGLSAHTVRRRLGELRKAGLLEVSQTNEFPSLKRYSLLEQAEEIARTAVSMQKELHRLETECGKARREL